MNPIVSTLIKGMLYLILKAKQGGKYLSRKQVIDKRTGRKTWKYKYKPMQQRAAHEVTRGKFEKVTKLSGDEHKNQIEHALQNGIHVSLHVLRDYPDLAVKYHQQARLAKADKIRAKVKASKVKNEVKVDDTKGMTTNESLKPLPEGIENLAKIYLNDEAKFRVFNGYVPSKDRFNRVSNLRNFKSMVNFFSKKTPSVEGMTNPKLDEIRFWLNKIYSSEGAQAFINAKLMDDSPIELIRLQNRGYSVSILPDVRAKMAIRMQNEEIQQMAYLTKDLDAIRSTGGLSYNEDSQNQYMRLMIRMKLTGHEIPDSINPAKKIYELYPEVKSFLAPPVSDNREVENNFDTLAKYPRLKDGILSITKLTRDNIVKSLKGMSDDQIDEVLTQLYDTSKISGFNLLPSIKTVKGDSEFDIILKPLRDNFDEFRKEMSKIKINDLKNILTELGGVNYVGRENTKYEKNAIITSILKTALNKNDTTYTEQPNNFETMQDYVNSQLAEAKEAGIDVRNMEATLQDEYYAKLLENAHKEKIPVQAYESLRQDQKLHFDRKYPGMRDKTESEAKKQSDYDASVKKYMKPNNFETMPESKPAATSNKGIQLDEKHFDEKGQSEWIQDRRFYQKAVNNVAKNFSNATFRLDEVSPYGAKVIVTIDGKDQELTKSKVARADFKRLFGKSLEEMQTVESKPEPAKIVNEPAIPDKAVTDFIKKKKAQALGYGGSGKLISQSVFDNSKEMEFLAKYKDIITDTQLDPSISKQQANLLQYLPTDLSKKNYELVSDKDNNDKRYNVQKKLIDFSNQLKTKQLASNVIAELQKILSTHEYHTGDYTSNVDILLKRIEPYQRISSNTSPAKNPDLKANFESWKEERKQAPAFKLEQEDITSKEKNTRYMDAQGGLFGKKPTTHESYAKKDFKPSLALEGNETITSLVTAVKSALMREGLDTKAREFVDKAFKEKDISSLKKLASEYVKLQSVDDVY